MSDFEHCYDVFVEIHHIYGVMFLWHEDPFFYLKILNIFFTRVLIRFFRIAGINVDDIKHT